MSTVATIDMTIHQGMIFAQPFAPSVYDETSKSLVARDYTGYRATFTIWPSPATLDSLHGTTPVLSVTSESGAIELGLFDGGRFGEYGILVYLTQTQTSALSPWGTGVFNLDLVDAYNHPHLRIRGTIRLEEGKKHD